MSADQMPKRRSRVPFSAPAYSSRLIEWERGRYRSIASARPALAMAISLSMKHCPTNRRYWSLSMISLALDHLPQVAASGETTRPDLSVLDSGLLQLACIDRSNSDALPPHADRVAVDHTRRSRPGGGLGHGAPRRGQQNRGGDGQSSSKSQFSISQDWRAASPNTDRARWSSPAAARSVMARK